MPARLTISELRALQSKPAKYRNKAVTFAGSRFDSTKELERYQLLTTLMRAGQIQNLERQPRIMLCVGGVPIVSATGRPISLVADFRYSRNSDVVIEDVKGFVTDVAALKGAIAKAMGLVVTYLKWSTRGHQWVCIKPVRSRRRRGHS